jgi:Family of unknown function (DUF6069)
MTVTTTSQTNIVKTGAPFVAAAAVANLVVGGVAKAADVVMVANKKEVVVPAFGIATLVAGFLGLGLAFLLAKRGMAPKVWGAIATGVAVLSLISPIVADATNAMRVVLVVAHVVAAVVIIPAVMKKLSAS